MPVVLQYYRLGYVQYPHPYFLFEKFVLLFSIKLCVVVKFERISTKYLTRVNLVFVRVCMRPCVLQVVLHFLSASTLICVRRSHIQASTMYPLKEHCHTRVEVLPFWRFVCTSKGLCGFQMWAAMGNQLLCEC